MLTALTDGRRFSHIERLREDPDDSGDLRHGVGRRGRHGEAVLQVGGSGPRGRVDRPQCAADVAGSAGSDHHGLGLDGAAEVRAPGGSRDRLQPRQAGPAELPSSAGGDCRHAPLPGVPVPSGDTVTATQWHEAMTDAERWLGSRKIWLNRGDMGLGHDAVMSLARGGARASEVPVQAEADEPGALGSVPGAGG
jgi:hypothetical protein